jgi:YkoY family integral membrane protein
MPPLLAFFEILGQRLEGTDLAVVALLVVLEGVLSIDNALVLGLLAKRLPKHEQGKALWYGLAGAFVFRFIAVLLASMLLRWTLAKFLGGAYLVYIAVRHLFFEAKEKEYDKIVLDEQGHPKLVEETTGQPLPPEEEETEIRERVPVYMKPETRKRLGLASFWPTVVVIELTDIAFAVDSIVAAIAMVGSPPKGTPADAVHPKLWVVILGGLLGLMVMRVAARLFIQLLDRFPRFEVSAYLLVIVIGLKLLADWGLNSDWSFDQPQWLADRMGGWKQPFEEFEAQRRGWVHDYETWLREEWIFGLAEHADHSQPDGDQPHDAAASDVIPHTPHLLDFHSPRRPEFVVFWTLMVACFSLGFVPKPPAPAPAMTTSSEKEATKNGERGA